MVRMPALQQALTDSGLQNVRTYIQSGNVIFDDEVDNTDKLAALVRKTLKDHFQLDVAVAVFSAADWQQVIKTAPIWWGKDPAWKHNMLIMLQPYDMTTVVADIGPLKPEIETMKIGKGVIYQSVQFDKFGRTTFSKMIGKPVYKQMTIRNYNTATKLAALLD